MSSVGRASGIRASAMLMTGTQRTRMDAQVAYGSIEWKKEINAEGVLWYGKLQGTFGEDGRVLLAVEHAWSQQEGQQSDEIDQDAVDIVRIEGRGVLATVDLIHVGVTPGSGSFDLGGRLLWCRGSRRGSHWRCRSDKARSSRTRLQDCRRRHAGMCCVCCEVRRE